MQNFRGVFNGGGTGGAPAPATDIFAPRIIVGITNGGSIATECHFLDTGNGAQLSLALAAAALLGGGADVWVQPGVIDMNAVGAPAGPFVIPDNVTLRGCSITSVLIGARTSGDTRVFTMGDQSWLENINVGVPATIGPTTVNPMLVECTGSSAFINTCSFFYTPMNGAQYLDFVAGSGALFPCCIMSRVACDQLVVLDSFVFDAPNSSLSPGSNQFFVVHSEAGNDKTVMIDRCIMTGGDYSVRTHATVGIHNSVLIPVELGVSLLTLADDSNIDGTRIRVVGNSGSERGVVINGVDNIKITDTEITNTLPGPSAGAIGVQVLASSDHVMDDLILDTWDTGVTFDAGSGTSDVGAFRVINSNATVIDLNGTNLVANVL